MAQYPLAGSMINPITMCHGGALGCSPGRGAGLNANLYLNLGGFTSMFNPQGRWQNPYTLGPTTYAQQWIQQRGTGLIWDEDLYDLDRTSSIFDIDPGFDIGRDFERLPVPGGQVIFEGCF